MIPRSTQLEWRPFRRSDLDDIELLEERDIIFQHREELHAMGESVTDDEFCGIASFEGRPILIGGWIREDAHTLRVFIMPTKNIFEQPRRFTCFILRWLAHMQALPGVERIITLSRCNDRIDRWMKTVGFVYEETLKQYADGHDYRLWSRTWATEA